MSMKINLKKLDILFLSIESMLYIFILFMDLGKYHRLIAFISILICFIYVVLNFKKNNHDDKIMLIAFIATLSADYFLTLHSKQVLLGTFLFFVSQVFFFLRIHLSNHKIDDKIIIVYTFTYFLCLILLYLIIGYIDLLLIVSLLYYVCLCLNMIYAWITKHKILLFAIGLTLYVCADFMVGLKSSGSYVTFAQGSIFDILIHFPINLIWVFYLPTQILFALSTTHKKLKEHTYV